MTDLPAIADLHLRARAAAYPAMPRGIHPPHEVQEWVAGWDLSEAAVWVAERDGLLGYARLWQDWLEDLYVDPAHQGQGVGSRLLEEVKTQRPHGFRLWVFESNTPARAFYRAHGLVEIDRTDGAGNEEKLPDVKMAWPGPAPAP
ncbi:GNAT family N-acetyltransferase [Pseudactinotalea suaedae]|uniref:GNAT family N-acetyltransferase n=1 Tax=Pseudactinotalea suaedae TaxID=1524924 RepID=UPI0012E24335|nr:GNAT family N-acetyltransferase [Pseudactinotalea suaedae]